MRPRLAVGCALVLAAAAPAFAQDWFEPNPSLARLSADDAYARTSAKSFEAAGIDNPSAVTIDAEGRLLVAGVAYDVRWAHLNVDPQYLADGYSSTQPVVVRLLADGSLDPSFGDHGAARVPVRGGTRVGIEVDAAGRVVIAGGLLAADAPDLSGPWYLAARLTADGALDASYSDDGFVDAPPGTGANAVHAAGTDGSMIVAPTWPGPSDTYHLPNLPRLIRILADGTIDATYDGDLAFLGPGRLQDFVVDSAGRAVVTLQDLQGNGFIPGLGYVYGLSTVRRLDAAGRLDGTVYSNLRVSQLALDGAGRIVERAGAKFLRSLPDGKLDPTFAGDGSAWNNAAGFLGPAWNGDDMAILCANARLDPDFAGFNCDGYGEFLAVATRADRWALAKIVDFRDAKHRVVAHGIEVQMIDPADPGAIVSTRYRFRDVPFSKVLGIAISPDGATAYAFGSTYVLRVDLAQRTPLPLPDLRVKWLGWPRARDFGGGHYRVTANVRIRNASRSEAAATWGLVGFAPGTYDIPLVAGPHLTISGQSVVGYGFRVRGRKSVVKRFTWEGGDTSTDLAGARLSIEVACELPDANPADNTATSRTITPLYAPR